MTLILKIPKFADIQKIIFFVQYEFYNTHLVL